MRVLLGAAAVVAMMAGSASAANMMSSDTLPPDGGGAVAAPQAATGAPVPQTNASAMPEWAANQDNGIDSYQERGLAAVENIPTINLYMKEVQGRVPPSNIVQQRYPVLSVRPNGRLDPDLLNLSLRRTDPAPIQPTQAAFLGG